MESLSGWLAHLPRIAGRRMMNSLVGSAGRGPICQALGKVTGICWKEESARIVRANVQRAWQTKVQGHKYRKSSNKPPGGNYLINPSKMVKIFNFLT